MDILHASGEEGGGDPGVCIVRAGDTGLSEAAGAGYLDLCCAGGIRTLARVAGGGTGVATWPADWTRLSAAGSGAGARVARPGAGVAATGNLFTTWFATGDAFHQTGDIPPLLVATIAQFGSEVGAGGTAGLAVAVVRDRVATLVLPPTQLRTLRWPGATCHRGEGDSRATVTCQF